MEWIKKEPKINYSEFDDIEHKLACIHGIEDLKKFLHPSEDELHSPFLLKNLEEGRSRIIQAIKNKEKISIFSDP